MQLPPLYAIVDPLDTNQDPIVLADAMLRGGARLLQLRLKQASPRIVFATARHLRRLTRAVGAQLVVNDRPDIARAVDADAVHLGQTDVPVSVARRILPPHIAIGVSTHDAAELAGAIADAPDYIAIGPIYDTGSKEPALPARGLALVRDARRRWPRPLVAIGGITPETAPAVRAAGADAVAMIGALVRAPDVTTAVRDTLAALAAA